MCLESFDLLIDSEKYLRLVSSFIAVFSIVRPLLIMLVFDLYEFQV